MSLIIGKLRKLQTPLSVRSQALILGFSEVAYILFPDHWKKRYQLIKIQSKIKFSHYNPESGKLTRIFLRISAVRAAQAGVDYIFPTAS